MVNIPVDDTLAFRASAKYAYEPGFTNAYGLLKRSNNGLSGIPELADPADPIGSPGIYSSKHDWNFQKTFTGRASALWKPIDGFAPEVAILHSNLKGDGGPNVNPDFRGRRVAHRSAHHAARGWALSGILANRSAVLALHQSAEPRPELRCGLRDRVLDELLLHHHR